MLDTLDLFAPTVLAEVAELNAVDRDVPTLPPKPRGIQLDYEAVLLSMHNGDRAALDRCQPCQWFLHYQQSRKN